MTHRAYAIALAGSLGLAALAGTAAPSLAQGWQFRQQGPVSETFTPSTSRQTALVLDCRPGRGISLRIETVLSAGWRANQPVSIRVGNASHAMQIEGGSTHVGLGNAPDGTLTTDIVGRLKGGATLVLEGPATTAMRPPSRTYSLQGAGAQIARLEQACGLRPVAAIRPEGAAATPAGAAAPAPVAPGAVPAEVQRLRAETNRECAGRATFGPKFQQTADFNGDGVADYVIDMGETQCPSGGMNQHCGSGGCTVMIFLSEGANHRRVFTDTIRAFTIERQGARSVLALALHGSACGRAGAATCHRRLAWNGRAFAPSGSR